VHRSINVSIVLIKFNFMMFISYVAFYLILNVAAGGTNGWFQDNVGGKPWVDQSATAMRDFAFHQSDWYSTWPQDPKQRGMVV